jgi:hypothetical protein
MAIYRKFLAEFRRKKNTKHSQAPFEPTTRVLVYFLIFHFCYICSCYVKLVKFNNRMLNLRTLLNK